MILLDTNVLSELRRAAGGRIDPQVLAWSDSLDGQRLFLSVITVLEVRKGVLGKARHDERQASVFQTWLTDWVLRTFAGLILPVNVEVALAAASLHVPVRQPEHDMLIAATALVHDLTLATRNVRDFAGTGVRLVDPWAYRVGTGSGPA